MKKYIDFPLGLTFHTSKEKSEFFKEFKKMLNGLSVAWYDPCCPEQESASGAALRISSGGELQTISPLGIIDLGIKSNPFNVSFSRAIVESRVAVAANVTQTLTAGPLSNGLITSTSAAAVSLTLPIASLLGIALGATRGTSFEFIVDNSAGANTVTVVLNTGITLPSTVVITGSNTLTVTSGNVGIFRLVFTTASTAKLFRIA